MASSHFMSSYAQYKADSDYVASWLVTTAGKCGYQVDKKITSATLKPKESRLKGKARKIAQSAKEGLVEGPKYLIAVKDFTLLAEIIANSVKPRIKVSVSFASAIERAISMRKRHAILWNRQNSGRDTDKEKETAANDSHAYFIKVLEDVRRLLQPLLPAVALRSAPVKSFHTSARPSATSANPFENLEVEDTPESSPIVENQMPNEGSDKMMQCQYSVRQDRRSETVEVACCAIEDMYQIRHYLKDVWTRYKYEQVDLISASITTNTAIEFVVTLLEDLRQAFPEIDLAEVIRSPWNTSFDGAERDYGTEQKFFNILHYELMDTIMEVGYRVVRWFADSSKNRSCFLVARQGGPSAYDPQADRSEMSSLQKLQEDFRLMNMMMLDFQLLAWNNLLPCKDIITDGLCKLFAKREEPFWLVFAVSIFMDIHHILREKASNGLRDLVRGTEAVRRSIDEILSFNRSYNDRDSALDLEKRLCAGRSSIDSLFGSDKLGDWKEKLMTRRLRQRDGSDLPEDFVPEPDEPFAFFKRHPLCCGLLLYHFKIVMQDNGIGYANQQSAVLCAAHLYNALRQEKLLFRDWKDMETVFNRHKPEVLFVGRCPQTLDECAKQLLLALDVPLNLFASGRRPQRKLSCRFHDHNKGLSDISPVLHLFRDSFYQGEVRPTLSSEAMETILTKRTGRLLPSGGDKLPSYSRDSRPVRLLATLLEALSVETPELDFDYFRLHIFSWRLMLKIRDAVGPDVAYNVPHSYRDVMVPYVAVPILKAAADVPRLAIIPPIKRRGTVIRGPLIEAARVMREEFESMETPDEAMEFLEEVLESSMDLRRAAIEE